MTVSLRGTEVQTIMCTADAKVCPDGSFVGRIGPNCDWAPCPTLTAAQEAARRALALNSGVTLSPAQLQQAIADGIVGPSTLTSTGAKVCESGYQFLNAQCVVKPSNAVYPVTETQWISGVDNKTLMIAGGVALALMLLGGSR